MDKQLRDNTEGKLFVEQYKLSNYYIFFFIQYDKYLKIIITVFYIKGKLQTIIKTEGHGRELNKD